MIELNDSRRKEMMNGVYLNFNFLSTVTNLIGNVVKVYTREGRAFEGILKTFSPYFHVVLEIVHEINTASPSTILPESIVDLMLFTSEDILTIEIIDTIIDGGANDVFQTDIENKIMGNEKSPETEKVLEPWDCSEENNEFYELGLAETEGWNPKEMFEKNEKLYGVTSDFNDGSSIYTVALKCEEPKVETIYSLKRNANFNLTKAKNEPSLLVETCPKQLCNIKTESRKSNKKSKASRKPQVPTVSVTKDCQSSKHPPKLNNNRFTGSEKNVLSSKPLNSYHSGSNSKKGGVTNCEATSVDSRLVAAGSLAATKSTLNPLAKEFIPACTRPCYSNMQMTATLPCPNLIPPPTTFQQPVNYGPPFYTWKPMIIYATNFPHRH